MNILKNIINILLTYLLAYDTSASQTLSPKNRGKQKRLVEVAEKDLPKLVKKNLPIARLGPQNYTVFDRGLVTDRVDIRDILINYQAFYSETDDYSFNGLIMGYVTPWNNHGYDVAKIFGNKFTHMSPVWFQIRKRGPKKYELTGTHNIDVQWIADVRNAGRERKTKIIPRVLFAGWSGNDYAPLFYDIQEVKLLTDILVGSCKQHKFDGYAMEVWNPIAGDEGSMKLTKFVRTLSDSFALENLEFILIVPPKRGRTETFTEDNFNSLYDHVTAYSLLTYDFAEPSRPGPNAPVYWMEEAVIALTSNNTRRPKIMMGFNFYGYDFFGDNKGGPIVSHQYIERLKKIPEKNLLYAGNEAEHCFQYSDEDGTEHMVFYPTLYSIFKRVNLAYQLNVGISIWELGQGLDYFYDLL